MRMACFPVTIAIGMIDRKNVAKATFLFERKTALEIGGYDPQFEIGAEDWAFMLALLEYGAQAIRIDYPVLNYTVTTTGRATMTYTRKQEVIAMMRTRFARVK